MNDDDTKAPEGREKITDGPRPARETIRLAMRAELEQDWCTVASLSAVVHTSERDVVGHLPHLQRSVARERGVDFEVEPSRCLACDFVFERRDRFTRPGRCPQCKTNRFSYPSFRIVRRG